MTDMAAAHSRLCECGCGSPAPIATRSVRRLGVRKGEPRRFILGHSGRALQASSFDYVVEDRGYKTPCWVWSGPKNEFGYGTASRTLAHKAMWERERGPVPDGLELDHLCRVRLCVNLAHLEVVTHQENVRRSAAVIYPQGVGVAGALRAARIAACQTQGDLAEVLGCTRSLIGVWEQGRYEPPAHWASALVAALPDLGGAIRGRTNG